MPSYTESTVQSIQVRCNSSLIGGYSLQKSNLHQFVTMQPEISCAQIIC